MIDEDLRRRAVRLLSGDHRVDDLDRLYLGQRTRARNRAAFLEVGDFVAHRELRNKGLVTQVARDVFTSADVWSMSFRGIHASFSDIARAAQANLRLASDDQLMEGCKCQRETARSRLTKAIAKTGRNMPLNDREIGVLGYLGNRLIWKPAFTAHQLASEFTEVLILNGVVEKAYLPQSQALSSFLALHALTVMHGSKLKLDNGNTARLLAGFANRERCLEIKIEIVFREQQKPIWIPICLFLTNLQPEGHCEMSLIPSEDPRLPDHWDMPLEVTKAGLIAPIH